MGLLVTGAILGGAVVGIVKCRGLAENAGQVTRSHEVIIGVRDLLSVVKDAETGQRGYLLTGDEAYLEPYEDALRRFKPVAAHLDDLTAGNRDEHARFIALSAAADAKIAELNRTVVLMKSGDRTAALAAVRTGSGKALMDDVRKNAAAIRETEDKLLEQHGADMRQGISTAIGSLVITAGVGLLLVSIAFVLSQHSIDARLRAAETIDKQREQLRVTLASIGDAVITTDADGPRHLPERGRRVADRLERGGGGGPAARGGLPHRQRADPASRSRTRRPGAAGGRRRRPGEPHGPHREGRHGAADRRQRRADPRTSEGAVAGCVLVFRDVTERRRWSEAEANQLASRSNAGGHRGVVGRRHRQQVAGRDRSRAGTRRRAALRLHRGGGRRAAHLAHDSGRPDDGGRRHHRADPTGERVDHFETMRLRKDGAAVHISVTISPIRDEAGNIVGASKIARDITDRKQAEARIYGRLGELQDADRRKDEFLATLAHELRNPLAPIRNALEMHAAGRQTATIRRAGPRHDGAAARPDGAAGGRPARRVPHQPRQARAAQGAGRAGGGRAQRGRDQPPAHRAHGPRADGHAAAGSRCPSTPTRPGCPGVREPAEQRRQVHASRGGRIWLTAERQGGDVVVTVRDTGIGIPPTCSRIFEMFTQVDRSLERSQGGLGIGLTLVKRLVEMHGGTVEAQQRGAGHGAASSSSGCRSLSEPPKPQQPAGRGSEPSAGTAAASWSWTTTGTAADSLAMLLKLMGNETRTAHDGLEAVEAAERRSGPT